MTFDLDLEHILDAGLPGDHRVQVWWRSGQLPARKSDLRRSLQTDRRGTLRHCISSFLEWANQTVNDELAHSKNPRKYAYHVTFDLDLEHTLDALQAYLVTIVCKFDHDRAICLGEEAICAKVYRQTDERRTPRHCISSFLEWAIDWNELITEWSLRSSTYSLHTVHS